MKELVELLKSLGLTESDAVDQVVAMAQSKVDAETEVGKGFYREKDSEAKKLREGLKKLGYDSEKHASVDEYLSAREKENNQKDVTLESLKAAVESLKGDLTSEKNLRTTEYTNRVKATAQAKLAEQLAPKIYGAKGTIAGILATSEIAMDGENLSIGGLSVDDFVKGYVADNPDDVKIDQGGGGGNPPAQDQTKDLNNMDTLSFMSAK